MGEVTFQWNKAIPTIANDATGGKRTLLFMANEAKKLMDPYVPARNMVLSRNVRVYAEGGKGIVHYLSPYAHYQYEGILMVSRITGSPWARHGESKVLTSRNLNHSKSRHPLATSEWDKAMKVSRGSDLVRATQQFIKGGAAAS